jgi:YfiH family protein
LVELIGAFRGFEGIVAGISTRKGGVSEPPYDSANMALHVGDDRAAVLKNRAKACSELGISAADLVCAEQVHGNRVVKVTDGDRGSGATCCDDAVPETDGLVTGVRDVPLAVFTADCVPILVYEAKRKVVGMGHAGWRGTSLRVAEALIRGLEEEFGGDPRSCLVALGPSAGPCCYEVGPEVVTAFRERGHPEGIFSRTEDDKFRLDMWQANALQLQDKGVPRSNISCSRRCTVCSEGYFSFRGDGAVTGRNMSVIMLK